MGVKLAQEYPIVVSPTRGTCYFHAYMIFLFPHRPVIRWCNSNTFGALYCLFTCVVCNLCHNTAILTDFIGNSPCIIQHIIVRQIFTGKQIVQTLNDRIISIPPLLSETQTAMGKGCARISAADIAKAYGFAMERDMNGQTLDVTEFL